MRPVTEPISEKSGTQRFHLQRYKRNGKKSNKNYFSVTDLVGHNNPCAYKRKTKNAKVIQCDLRHHSGRNERNDLRLMEINSSINYEVPFSSVSIMQFDCVQQTFISHDIFRLTNLALQQQRESKRKIKFIFHFRFWLFMKKVCHF